MYCCFMYPLPEMHSEEVEKINYVDVCYDG